jgi:hypothetical protein
VPVQSWERTQRITFALPLQSTPPPAERNTVHSSPTLHYHPPTYPPDITKRFDSTPLYYPPATCHGQPDQFAPCLEWPQHWIIPAPFHLVVFQYQDASCLRHHLRVNPGSHIPPIPSSPLWPPSPSSSLLPSSPQSAIVSACSSFSFVAPWLQVTMDNAPLR